MYKLLDMINYPDDLKKLSNSQLKELAGEIEVLIKKFPKQEGIYHLI